jgi:hypothetical protein
MARNPLHRTGALSLGLVFTIALQVAGGGGAILFSLPTHAASPADSASDAMTRKNAHDILKQLIEINTTDSVGSTTVAAQAMAKRLVDAGFPKEDVAVLGPNDRRRQLRVAETLSRFDRYGRKARCSALVSSLA